VQKNGEQCNDHPQEFLSIQSTSSLTFFSCLNLFGIGNSSSSTTDHSVTFFIVCNYTGPLSLSL